MSYQEHCNIMHILTGFEVYSKFVVPEIPTIARCEAEGNSLYQRDNKLAITPIKCFNIPNKTTF